LIGICREDYPVSDFDAEFLGEAVKSWKTNANMLDLTPQQRFDIEQKARELGLF
jgi:hypothetical protein